MHGRLGPVDAELPDGGVSAVTGPSGAGKSTLLRLCNRLVAPDAGRVTFRGADVAALDVLAHRRRVGLVLQHPVPFPGTVLDNLRVADPALDEAGAAALLERCALDAAFLPRRADALSGGEAQRACLARTLATRPAVLLADEPTAALDPAAAGVLEGLLRGLADEEGKPVVLVTHDAAQRARLADHELTLGAR